MATLKARVDALATRMGNYLRDNVLPRLVSTGGNTGQTLVKTAAGFGWLGGGFIYSVVGKTLASERYSVTAPYAFTALQANCSAKALVAATATAVFTIKKGTVASPTTVGTFSFAASGTVATVSITAGSIAAGDIVWIEPPGSPDATLADISFAVRP